MGALDAGAAPVINTGISKLAFKTRFPRAKWMYYKSLVATDTSIADFYDSFSLASRDTVHVDAKDVKAAIAYLSSEKITDATRRLTADDAAKILSLDITQDERP